MWVPWLFVHCVIVVCRPPHAARCARSIGSGGGTPMSRGHGSGFSGNALSASMKPEHNTAPAQCT
jgi:hypothetical protein